MSLQNAVVVMVVQCALSYKKIPNSVTSQAPPHLHTSSSMLHCGNHAYRDHPFTFYAVHKDVAG